MLELLAALIGLAALYVAIYAAMRLLAWGHLFLFLLALL